MAIETVSPKARVQKLIDFFLRKQEVVRGSDRLHEADNPFGEVGVFGKVPNPNQFSKILYSRLKATQTMAVQDPDGKTRVYENEKISIFVSNRLMAENFLNEGILNIYCNPMYEAMYAYMRKSQNSENVCSNVEALNKATSIFEIALNQEA